ncbi:MAB_1171c family putative transporter [Streptosporangium carneum]|uniref:MAB_1171c family putative transporter n=1 Tax=Streptosporangium carneum TaxID=47481 RepID=UPI0022F2B3D0|nr:MAB_1171c family putative transporter [Streptosporangium carneum]
MISYIASGLLVLISAGKLAAARRVPLSPGMRYLLGFFLSMAAALAVSAEPTVRLLPANELPTTALVCRLVSNALQVLAVHFLVRLARATQTPVPRTRLWPLVLCWALMAVCLVDLVLHVDQFSAPGFGWRVGAVGYQVVLVGYAVGCLMTFMRVLTRHARQCPRGSFRTGLRVIVTASAVTVVWGLYSGLPTLWLSVTSLSGADFLPVGRMIGLMAMALWVVGAVVTTWQGMVERPLRWLTARRDLRSVTPLWSVLVAALPGIALPPPARCGAEFALYRKLIEIRDGLLVLRRHVPPELADWVRESARRHAAAEDEPTVAAAEVAAALVARKSGHSWPQPPAARTSSVPSIDAETAWLSAVSAAFTGSPVVDEVRKRAGATYAMPAEAV